MFVIVCTIFGEGSSYKGLFLVKAPSSALTVKKILRQYAKRMFKYGLNMVSSSEIVPLIAYCNIDAKIVKHLSFT